MTLNRKTIFPFLLVFFEMVTYLSSDMYLPAIPDVMKTFHLTPGQAQLSLTFWFIGAMSLQLFLGPISERFGRRSVLCIGTCIFTLSSLGCALATTYPLFLVFRCIQGSGISFMAVPGYASIHESYDQKTAIKLMALMGSIAIIAPAFGPLVGSLIMLHVSWQAIFLFITGWALLASILLIKFMPETLPPNQRVASDLKATVSSYASIFKNPQFMRLLTIYGLLFCAFLIWILAGPFLVISWFNRSPLLFGYYQILIFMSYILANYLVKFLIDKMSAENLLSLGLLLCLFISILALIYTYLNPTHLLGFVIFYMLFSFCSAFAFGPLNRITIEASTAPMGARTAVFSLGLNTFSSLGSVLMTLLYRGPMLTLTLMMTILLCLCLLINWRNKAR